MKNPLRRFTPQGIEKFREFLTGPSSSGLPLARQLQDSAISEPISGLAQGVDLAGLGPSVSQFDFAKFMTSQITGVAQQSLLIDDEAAGAYLVAARFDLFAERDSSNHWKLRDQHRYIPKLESPRLFLRHPVAKIALYEACGASAEICLHGSTKIHSDVMEQVASRSDIACSPEMMKAISKLYWDPKGQKLKDTRVTSNRRPLPDGCLRRFVGPGGFIDRFETTHDFLSMSCDQILDLLPSEFDGYNPRAQASTP